MKTWPEALRDGAVSGSIASVLTTAVLSGCGIRENGTPFAPTNAISHWLWGDHATYQDHPSARYTLPGYVIHHASATLWGVLYEKWFGNSADEKAIIPAVAAGATVAGLACFVDYNLTPRRLRPGYEKRLSTQSLFILYGTFGIALAMRGLISGRRRVR
jgi:hypothetical protein